MSLHLLQFKLMRIFGQKYGLIGFQAQVNLHNRYLPAFEIGLAKGWTI